MGRKLSEIIYSFKKIKLIDSKNESWFVHFILNKIVFPLLYIIANYTKIHSNHITFISLLLGIISAFCFYIGKYSSASILYLLSFLCDCLDGKLARLKQNGSIYGPWLDLIVDRFIYGIIIFSYCHSLSVLKGDMIYQILGFFILFFMYLGEISRDKLLEYSLSKRKGLSRVTDHTINNIMFKKNKCRFLKSYINFTKRHRIQILPVELIEIQIYLFVISPWLINFKLLFNAGFIFILVLLIFRWTLVPVVFWKKERKFKDEKY